MTVEKPTVHGRDHLPGGADPIPGLENLGGIGDGTINAEIDGRGTFISAGTELDFTQNFDYTINGWKLLADAVGSIVVDIRKDVYASFPPTGGDSIVASAPPTLSSADHNASTTLTGWTTAVVAGDVIRLHVTSCTGIGRICLALDITRTG